MSANGQAPTQAGTATSRARFARPAVRRRSKARLALSGPSGSGKTWTALGVAEVLAPGGRTVLIDTEFESAELYADNFRFEHLPWEPPYDPRDLAATLQDLGRGGYDVIIVDSASHFWRGAGGTLDIADGRFGGWKTATPAQDDLVEAILRSPAHVICCTRAKQSYEVEQDPDGKQKVKKLGLAPIQRDDLEYEFSVVGMLDSEHRLDIGKTRCPDLAGKSFAANHQLEVGAIYGEWLKGGEPLARQADVDALVTAMDGIADADVRKRIKQAFRNELGLPSSLRESQIPAGWALLAAQLDLDPHPYQGAGESAPCDLCSAPSAVAWHVDEAPTDEGQPAEGEPSEAQV